MSWLDPVAPQNSKRPQHCPAERACTEVCFILNLAGNAGLAQGCEKGNQFRLQMSGLPRDGRTDTHTHPPGSCSLACCRGSPDSCGWRPRQGTHDVLSGGLCGDNHSRPCTRPWLSPAMALAPPLWTSLSRVPTGCAPCLASGPRSAAYPNPSYLDTLLGASGWLSRSVRLLISAPVVISGL